MSKKTERADTHAHARRGNRAHRQSEEAGIGDGAEKQFWKREARYTETKFRREMREKKVLVPRTGHQQVFQERRKVYRDGGKFEPD